MYSAVRPLLFALDPERAHGVARLGLKALHALGFLTKAGEKRAPVKLAGIEFPNPVGIAAGFDKDAELVPALAGLGFGYIEVGTLTRRSQPGNPKPRIFRYPEQQALVNRLGFNNCGVEDAARRLEKLRRTVPIGVNIGKNAATLLEDSPKEYAECAEIVHGVADYIVLNISSPNTADLRKMHEPDRLRELADTVLDAVDKKGYKPVFLKVSPDASRAELAAAAKVALESRMGLIATNTTTDRTGLPGIENGGLSGEPLKHRANDTMKYLRELTHGKVPLIGVGGIFGAVDAMERFAAGADLIQLYTGFVYRGPEIVEEIVSALVKHGRPPHPGHSPDLSRGERSAPELL